MSGILAVKGSRRLAIALPVLFAFLIAGCGILPSLSGNEDGPNATITALQATINANPTATATAPATATLPPTAAPPPTLVRPTSAPATPVSMTTPVANIPTSGAAPPPTQGSGNPNIEQQILSSKVLLYEDMAGNPEVFRYVAAALQRLGFQDGSYVDTGDAQGRFLTQMSGGAPGGQPWDLIIIANEDRDAIQGTYFEVLEPILNTGKTAVILEAWHLDEIKEGTVKPILLKCGVDVTNWEGAGSSSLNIFTLDPNSPLLNEVVHVTGFNVLDYWEWYTDLGDLMYTTGTGDAKLAVGAEPGNTSQGGVLTECYNGRLILQTMSSHNYTDDTMVSLWENYIHYALRRIHGG